MQSGTKKFLGVALLGLAGVGAYMYYKGKQATSAVKGLNVDMSGCSGCGQTRGIVAEPMGKLFQAQQWLAAQKHPTVSYDVHESVDQATGLAGLAAIDMDEVFKRVDDGLTVETIPAHGIGVATVKAFRRMRRT